MCIRVNAKELPPFGLSIESYKRKVVHPFQLLYCKMNTPIVSHFALFIGIQRYVYEDVFSIFYNKLQHDHPFPAPHVTENEKSSSRSVSENTIIVVGLFFFY